VRSTWQEFAAIYAWMARSLSQTRLPGEVLLRLENSPVEWSAAQYEAASIIDFDAKEPCGFDPCRRQVSTASSRRMRRRVRLRTLFRRFQDDPTLVTSLATTNVARLEYELHTSPENLHAEAKGTLYEPTRRGPADRVFRKHPSEMGEPSPRNGCDAVWRD